MKVEIKKATIENLNDILKLNQQLFDYEYANFDKTLNCGWAKKNKTHRIKVLASSKNKLAIKFYKKMGFKDYDVVLEADI